MQYADGAREGGVAPGAVDCLLVCLAPLVVPVRAPERVPLFILRAGLGEVVDREVLVLERGCALVVRPSELLEGFGVRWVVADDVIVCALSPLVLDARCVGGTMADTRRGSRPPAARRHCQSGTSCWCVRGSWAGCAATCR